MTVASLSRLSCALGNRKEVLARVRGDPSRDQQCGFRDRQQHGMVADRFVVTGATLQKVRTAL